ncbi:uncharacterized protein LOC143038259 [Oratosquilla oratoria]|uniref:uncharacterized protein LOC143038259 n=1 Tax=Oratosquilla oratoria TaxID=337810 RepID=UPI003F76D9F8
MGVPLGTDLLLYTRILLVALVLLAEISVAKKCKYNGKKYKKDTEIEVHSDSCTKLVCVASTGKKKSPVKVMLVQDPGECECQLSRSKSSTNSNVTRTWGAQDLDERGGTKEFWFPREGNVLPDNNAEKEPSKKVTKHQNKQTRAKTILKRFDGISGAVKEFHSTGDSEYIRPQNRNSSATSNKPRTLKRSKTRQTKPDKDVQREVWGETGTLGQRMTVRRKLKKKAKACKYNKVKVPVDQMADALEERCVHVVCAKNEDTGRSELKMEVIQDCTCSSDGGGGGGTCEDYSVFTAQHSMCLGENKDCNIVSQGITENEKKVILKYHNKFRQQVANGEEDRGNPGPQPKAADMREFVWNDELALVAQAWANTCPYGHDCSECRKILGEEYFVGQNLYWYFTTDPGATFGPERWVTGITAWYDEVIFVPSSMAESFNPNLVTQQIGHYTQIVWGDTHEVGCGATYYDNCSPLGSPSSFNKCLIYACNYGKAGNFLSKPFYAQGEPASQCPSGQSNKYDGLCK